MSVQTMKGGAVEFLAKQFRDQDLLDAVQLALAQDRVWRQNEQALVELRQHYSTLTPREREVMALAMTGRLNKFALIIEPAAPRQPHTEDQASRAVGPSGG
jgi:FixJ family two-component response regulator